MDDAPDFDDLLEDAMMQEDEEEFDEYPYYDEGDDDDNNNHDSDENENALERMMLETTNQLEPKQQQQQQQSPDPALATTTITTPMMEDGNDDDDDLSMESPGSNHHRNHQYGSPMRRSKKDAFSFERYTSGSVWRSEHIDSPQRATLRATEWKKKGHANDHHHFDNRGGGVRNNSLLSTPPEVHLLRHHHSSDTVTSRVVLKTIESYTTSRLSSRPQPGVLTRTITLSDGNQLHIREWKSPSTSTNTTDSNNAGLLGASNGIFERVQAKRRQREHERVAVTQQDDDDIEHVNASSSSSSSLSPTLNRRDRHRDKPKRDSTNQLWVDKHAPSAFAHLLSDDRTNRQVIQALRAWDPYVFHTDPPPKADFGNHSNNPNNIHSPTKTFDKPNNANSKDKRPDEAHRVLLLSGNPGVGKTTLAHVAARHCGYRPLEINGSDDRSTDVLRDKVLRAMESTTLHNFSSHADSGKPNCLILDEIDGADANGAIKALVEIIRAEIPSGKDKKNHPYLRRPIIFICNNKYAPALRPLLPYAVHFNAEPPTPVKLVARLRSVLKVERLSLVGGSSLLNQLVAVAGGDIRYCLFALQFAASRVTKQQQQPESGFVDISSALSQSLRGGGLKDTHSDVLSVTTSVFQKRKGGRKEKSSFGRESNTEKGSDSDYIQSIVASYGDNSKLLDLLFLNAIRVSFIDPTFDRCAAMYEWMSQADTFRSSNSVSALTNSSLHYAMQSHYIPITAGVLHCLCRVEQRQDLKFSDRELSDVHFHKEANLELASQISEGISPHSRAARSTSLMGVETASYVLWILSAGNGKLALDRSVSSQHLLKDDEKTNFAHHVETLQALGLSYIAEPREFGNQGGQQDFRLRLEPPIQRFARYVEGPRPRRRPIPDTLKELLAQAVRARKSQALLEPEKDKQRAVIKPPSKNHLPVIKPVVPSSLNSKRKESPTAAIPKLPIKKQKAGMTATNFLGLGARKAKAALTDRKMARAGLERSKTANRVSNTGSGVQLAKVMRLKHVKGFTQAVRVPCRLEDLA